MEPRNSVPHELSQSLFPTWREFGSVADYSNRAIETRMMLPIQDSVPSGQVVEAVVLAISEFDLRG